jgi:hypothetical protein
MINFIFKSNAMFRILAIEIVNTILLPIFNDKILEKLMVCLDNFSAFFGVSLVEKG